MNGRRILAALVMIGIFPVVAGAQVGAKSPITSQGEDATKKGMAHCPL